MTIRAPDGANNNCILAQIHIIRFSRENMTDDLQSATLNISQTYLAAKLSLLNIIPCICSSSSRRLASCTHTSYFQAASETSNKDLFVSFSTIRHQQYCHNCHQNYLEKQKREKHGLLAFFAPRCFSPPLFFPPPAGQIPTIVSAVIPYFQNYKTKPSY